MVEYISDTVGVMYLGNLVEYGATEDIFRNPLHPYTKALFSAIPVPDPTVKMDRIVLEGSIPSPANPPAGCKFHTAAPTAWRSARPRCLSSVRSSRATMWSAICTTRHERPAQGVGGRRPHGSGYVGLDRPPLFGHKEGTSRKKQQEPSDGDYVPPLSRGDRWAFLLAP